MTTTSSGCWSKANGRVFGCGFVVLAALAAATFAKAADFPTKPVRIVIPAAPGGALDITTRLVANKMGEKLGQTVLVDNRPGGDTLLGSRMVKDAAPDGYTLLAQANGFNMLPYIRTDLGFDPVRDFVGLGVMTRSPVVMEVGADQPFMTVQDLVTRFTAEPGRFSFASGGVGTPPHLSAALFLKAAGLQATHVPYRGNGAALPDVAAGRVNMIFDGYISSLPYLKGNKIRALAVTSTSRIAPLPDVPTFREAGIDYVYTLWLGLLAPAGTAPDALARLSDALRYALESKDLSERFVSEGSDPTFMTPQAFDDFLRQDYTFNGRAAAELKLQKE